MSSPTESSSSDGRNARRDTNILLALTTAQLMFDEDILVPSIEAVAERSGISARSLYRYFEDPQTLVRHAIEHAAEEAYNLMSIDNIGEGPLTKRIDEMVASRLRGYQYIAGSVRGGSSCATTRPKRVRTIARQRPPPQAGTVQDAVRTRAVASERTRARFDQRSLQHAPHDGKHRHVASPTRTVV